MLQFKDIEIGDKKEFERFTTCHGYHNLEACFGNIFLWRKAWNIRMATDALAMYLLLDDGSHPPFLLPPFLDDCDTDIGEPIARCEAYMRETYGKPLFLKGVTSQLKQKMEADCPDAFMFTEDRPNYEYVYRSEDLANLTGKKYHAKRNHINKLINSHSWEYRRNLGEYSDACIELQKRWIHGKGGMNESYKDELYVTEQALRHMDVLGIVCGMLFVDGNLEAFSIGQQYGDDMAVVHIEKANPDVRGTYPLINREFVRNEWMHVQYINREEDMGLEGLRKAKLSYNPVFLLEKYDCVRK